MKNSLVSICLSMLVFAAWAGDVYRDFTNTEGQIVRGRVASVDARKQTVRIERDDNAQFNIPLSGLSEADQAYILAWVKAQGFMDKSKFKIHADDKKVDESKEEKTRDVTYTSGDVVKDFLINVISREKIAYEIEFRNSNLDALEGIRMEYQIYYEQSKMTNDDTKPEPQQEIMKDEMSLPVVPGKGRITATTKPVEIYEDKINPIPQLGGDHRQGGKGRVYGIRARLYMMLSTGEELVREFQHPKSLSDEKFPWQ